MYCGHTVSFYPNDSDFCQHISWLASHLGNIWLLNFCINWEVVDAAGAQWKSQIPIADFRDAPAASENSWWKNLLIFIYNSNQAELALAAVETFQAIYDMYSWCSVGIFTNLDVMTQWIFSAQQRGKTGAKETKKYHFRHAWVTQLLLVAANLFVPSAATAVPWGFTYSVNVV